MKAYLIMLWFLVVFFVSYIPENNAKIKQHNQRMQFLQGTYKVCNKTEESCIILNDIRLNEVLYSKDIKSINFINGTSDEKI